ncbi:hypothetical protein T265_08809 [Opisthorchis viverrini]|uniref:Uncharacterized protein n=1 Tax=Opisthorchis viverrini TaxID=6198 RepID=A0A075A759_OPIVI|nr:hypothetical protein T265_08809 [Opisthorchis viverrini]KER23274.1 hypothetical protein T265_08809 [Opisthorchis viverrini]
MLQQDPHVISEENKSGSVLLVTLRQLSGVWDQTKHCLKGPQLRKCSFPGQLTCDAVVIVNLKYKGYMVVGIIKSTTDITSPIGTRFTSTTQCDG